MSEMDLRGVPDEDREAVDQEEPDSEASEADAREQHQPVSPDGSGAEWPDSVPLDADPADAADQNRTVELDEDDYR